MIHLGTLRNLIKFQLDNYADILVAPSVPITSYRHFQDQLEKSKDMFNQTQQLLNTTFNLFKGKKDIMNLLTISGRLLTQREHFTPIIDALLGVSEDPWVSHIGVKFTDLDRTNNNQIQSAFSLLKDMNNSMKERGEVKPLHVVNMDQMGYACFCYGTVSLTMPIACDPYFYGTRNKKDISPARKGTYYYPAKMEYYVYDRLLEETRSNGYKLPCHCAICERYQNLLNIEPHINYNLFRRIHDILYKGIENRMFREVTIPFHEALKDMFARSRVAWITYIPEAPLVAF